MVPLRQERGDKGRLLPSTVWRDSVDNPKPVPPARTAKTRKLQPLILVCVFCNVFAMQWGSAEQSGPAGKCLFSLCGKGLKCCFWGFCKWLLFSVMHLKGGSKLRVWGHQCHLVLSHEADPSCDFSSARVPVPTRESVRMNAEL